MNNLTYNLPGDLAQNVKATLEDWKKNNKVKRLWAREASLWTNKDEGNWLGWLGIVDEQIAHNADFNVLTERERRALRVHFTGDLTTGLKSLQQAVEQALS